MSPHAPHALGFSPGPVYRWTRRLVQTLALLAVLVAPVLGGWQRSSRSDMAAWDAGGFDLVASLRHALPVGAPAREAYELNLLKGGGIAHEYFGIAAMDPLAGTLSLLRGGFDGPALLAWLLPLSLGLIAGRAFCGWLCPFGTLSRWLDAALSLLPFAHRIALPKRRPVRYALIAAAVGAGLLGFHLLLYLMLPYLLLQQGVYALWLLGGGGAALGLLFGLLLAGVLFGPTTYCATLCPTGGVLALLGRARRLHLTLREPARCGRSCTLCSRACWLQLDPARGDPGPDCDLCGRCVPACPRTNLVVTGRPPRKRLPVVRGAGAGIAALAIAGLLPQLGAPAVARADTAIKPRLVLDQEVRRGGTTLAASVVDMTGVELVGQSGVDSGIVLSIFIARGKRARPHDDGLLPPRDVYRGPLTVEVEHGQTVTRVPFAQPNAPRSTQGKAIYDVALPFTLGPGDAVHVLPVVGWLAAGERFVVPDRGTRTGAAVGAAYALAGLLIFGGLLSLSLSLSRR